MTVTIKYFASLREIIGHSQETIKLNNKKMTAADLWGQVSAGKQSLPSDILTAVNMEYVKPDTLINDGDEVAFFPPVTGG